MKKKISTARFWEGGGGCGGEKKKKKRGGKNWGNYRSGFTEGGRHPGAVKSHRGRIQIFLGAHDERFRESIRSKTQKRGEDPFSNTLQKRQRGRQKKRGHGGWGQTRGKRGPNPTRTVDSGSSSNKAEKGKGSDRLLSSNNWMCKERGEGRVNARD